MKTHKNFFLYFNILCLAISAQAQGVFQNLDFESANLPSVPPGQSGGFVRISDAIPGWSGFLGTNQVIDVRHNSVTFGSASIDILGPNWSSSLGTIMEGQYTVVLEAGLNPFSGNPFDN